MQQSSGNMNVVDYATSTMTFWGRRHVKSHITMLYGMPAAWAVETLAHEAAHVWCREHGVRTLTSDAEEGFCNVVACLVLQQLGARYEAPEQIQALFSNPDPVYGGQFRQQWQKLQQRGWPAYMAHIQTGA